MRTRSISIAVGLAVLGLAALAPAQTEVRKRHNPVIDLLEQKQPVFGLYAPSNRRFSPPGAPTPAPVPPKTPLELAQAAVANKSNDYIFDGGMEGEFDKGY